MKESQEIKPAIEYVPPTPESLRVYAKAVCEGLAERLNDPVFLSRDVISGFAHFLEVITRIHAKYLSKTGGVIDDILE